MYDKNNGETISFIALI